ncbi:MAG: purine-nucleoside phosphorylase [Candidatus Kerfeldbacteria bacterium]|nr:purine-nucleoside phosphorylase [Candidatus Kerfeldbacteria bacterium]
MSTLETLDLLKRNPIAAASQAAAELKRRTGVVKHHVAIILGSGWDVVAPYLGEMALDFPAAELPGFLPSGVEGHAGRIRSIRAEDKRVLAFLGRKHLYEVGEDGHNLPVAATVHAVRTAAAAGCTSIILTNAVGGLNPAMPTGTTVLIKDHVSFFVPSPLAGPNFLQCDEVYSRRLRGACRELNLPEGIYAQVRGPHFESPAEAEFLRRMGVDIVGMSIATEALTARDLKMEVLGLSIVTDSAGELTSHGDVLAVVRQTASTLALQLAQVINRL